MDLPVTPSTPNTPSVDLLAPSNSFDAASRLSVRLHRYQLQLSRRWWVLALVLCGVLGPAYIFTASSPPVYESRARMWLTGRLDLSEGRFYNEELGSILGTQAELLRSPRIQQRALAQLGNQFSNPPPATVPSGGAAYAKQIRDGAVKLWKDFVPYGPAASTPSESALSFQVEVAESSKSSFLELRATGADPKATRAFLNHLMGEFLNFKKEVRGQSSDRAVASVSAQVAQLANDLKAQQEKMHAFQMSNNVVFLQEQGNSAGSYLALLNKQLAALRTEYQLLLLLQPDQMISLGAKTPGGAPGEAFPGEASAKELLTSLAGPQAELFKARQQIRLLQAKKDELAPFLRPTHPKIIKLNEEIATQEKLAQISRDESLSQLANRRKTVALEIQNLEAAFQEWDGKAISASRKMAEYERIRQDLQRLQATHDRLLGVIQTVDVSKTLDQENVSIMEPASVARPVSGLFRNMLMALAAALAAGFGLLYVMGIFDDRFASMAELRGHFSELVVGQIPEIPLKRPKGKLEMDALEKHRFEFLESFRNLRSSLLFMEAEGTRPKVILIASSVPKEGKSTVTTYLAATLAMGGSRVLLVDADMRRASLHKYFNAAVKPGLAEILGQEASAAQAILPTSVANLFLLPAGEARRNPGELVLSSQWDQLLREVSPDFDFVLIDSPPILATDDASSLASKVDGVLFVVRASFTSSRMAREALDLFHHRQANVLGLIFNRAVASAYADYHYQRYKDAYHWRPAEKKGSRRLAGRTAPEPVEVKT